MAIFRGGALASADEKYGELGWVATVKLKG